jgi:hypothetical protein
MSQVGAGKDLILGKPGKRAKEQKGKSGNRAEIFEEKLSRVTFRACFLSR